MTAWLYKYIFRGFGVVFVIGMITTLFITVLGQWRHEHQTSHQVRPAHTAPATSGR